MHDSSHGTQHYVVDPVCGMAIDPETARAEEEWNGKLYSFCSFPCLVKFRRNPARYAAAVPTPTHDCCSPKRS